MDGRVHETDQGFEAVADASIDKALSATEMAFTLLKIEPAESGESRAVRGYSKEHDVEVNVILETYASGATRVAVTAQLGRSEDPSEYEGNVDAVVDSATRTATNNVLALSGRTRFWDKKFARRVLDKILEFTGLAVPRKGG